MKKKEYITPQTESIVIDTTRKLMATSGVVSNDEYGFIFGGEDDGTHDPE